jgi:hypothetical protein
MGDFRSFKTARRLLATPMEPVADPAGWSPERLKDVSRWSYKISDRDADELADGIASVRRSGVAVVDVSRESFPLKHFGDVLLDVRRELMDGLGIVMMQRLSITSTGRRPRSPISGSVPISGRPCRRTRWATFSAT